MTTLRLTIAFTAIAILGTLGCMGATSFSAMGVEEVSMLLESAASAKDAAYMFPEVKRPLPVELDARDMVTKVYGIIDPGLSKSECVSRTRKLLSLTPGEEEGVLWLDSDQGYRINYYGMLPETSAMARYGHTGIADYGYFFLFPYSNGGKAQTIRQQADFCGTLLQEMHDNGLPMDLNTATSDLFEAVGDYHGSLVDVRLLDEPGEGGAGRFILILSVEPNAFTKF